MKNKMTKEYEISKTQNGFIIRFDHLAKSYEEENQFVALDLESTIEIIKKDLEELLLEEKKTRSRCEFIRIN